MVETWKEKKGWNRVKEHLLEAFRWRCQCAQKEKNKGKAMGQITIGIKKEIAKEEEETKKAKSEKIQIRKLTLEKKIWKIITVYI